MERLCPSSLLDSSKESPFCFENQFKLDSEIGLCDSGNLDWKKSTEESLSDVISQCSETLPASLLPSFRTYLIKRSERLSNRTSKQSSPSSARFVRTIQTSPRPSRVQFQHRIGCSMNSERPLAASTEAQSQAESLKRSPKSSQEMEGILELSISCDSEAPAFSLDRHNSLCLQLTATSLRTS